MIKPIDLRSGLLTGSVGVYGGLPIIESPAMTWKDPSILLSGSGEQVILVGDARFFRMQVEARYEARDIVRRGMADIIEWLEASK